MRISITLLGELQVCHDDQPVKLPASRLTRALMVYLLQSPGPQRRDRLCDIFWDIPQDPRAALRWSLSRLRHIFNDDNNQRLLADRERVSIDLSDIDIDVNELTRLSVHEQLSVEDLEVLAQQLEKPFLADIELQNHEFFQQWLAARRSEIKALRATILARLAFHPMNSLSQRLHWARLWEQAEPLNPQAATQLISLLELSGHTAELAESSEQLSRRFRRAGISWSVDNTVKRRLAEHQHGGERPVSALLKASATEQTQVQYCQTDDGVTLAYTSVGQGPVIVKACNWLNNLQHDWQSPVWSKIYKDLAKDFQLIRYDERGTGMSDWAITDFSFTRQVQDLQTIIDASQADKFVLLGMSQGAAQSIAYAVKYPQRVSHLILFGAYAAGWLAEADEKLQQRMQGIIALADSGWEQDNPAFRQFFSLSFIPQGNHEEISWLNEYQRLSASAHTASQLMKAFAYLDVRDLLAKVRVPTLVIHSKRDEAIAIQYGRDIAASIPDAEFVSLESSSHLLLNSEPASQQFIDVVREFIARR